MTAQPGETGVCCLTREEVGLAIDGVVQLVRPTSGREYAPLLRKLQDAYRPRAPSSLPDGQKDGGR